MIQTPQTAEVGLERYESAIHECNLVGIGATSMSWPTALDVIKAIRKRRPDVAIVVGGIHATMFDRYLLTAFPIKFVVRGESEVALIELVHALEMGGDVTLVPNLSWKTPGGSIVRNPISPKILAPDLPKFALPDYSELPRGLYRGLAIESSRGCAFDCSFCSTSCRLSWRGLDPVVFVDRLETMLQYAERTTMQNLHIIDDEFSMNPR